MVYYLDNIQMVGSSPKPTAKITYKRKVFCKNVRSSDLEQWVFWEYMRVGAGYYIVYNRDPQINSGCSCVKWRLDPRLAVCYASSKQAAYFSYPSYLSKHLQLQYIGLHSFLHCATNNGVLKIPAGTTQLRL